MRDNIITMAYYDKTVKTVATPSFVPRYHGRMAFVHRWLWRLINKIGAAVPYLDEVTEYKRVVIDKGNFVDNLLVAYQRCFPHGRPTKVYVGPEQFEQLAQQQYDYRGIFTFDVNIGHNGRLFNLPITVVPHINGVLIV